MTALGVLLPRCLLRFGMEFAWAHRWGMLFLLLALVNMTVTVLFQADVDDQRGAYATGVLALILTTSLATFGESRVLRRERKRSCHAVWRFSATAVLFAGMLLTVMLVTPSDCSSAAASSA